MPSASATHGPAHTSSLAGSKRSIVLAHPNVRQIRGWRCEVDLPEQVVQFMRDVQVEGGSYLIHQTEIELGYDYWPAGYTRIFRDSLQAMEVTAADLVPEGYNSTHGMTKTRPTDEFRIVDMYITSGSRSLPSSWLKTIGDLDWLETLTIQSDGCPSVENLLRVLDLRPKRLRRLAMVSNDERDPHDIVDGNRTPISDLTRILLAGEKIGAHLELAIRMDYTPSSVTELHSDCLKLARERGREHVAVDVSERCLRPQAMSIFVYIATNGLPQDLMESMSTIAHSHQLLSAAMPNLDLYLCFDDRWLDLIYLHYRWRCAALSMERSAHLHRELRSCRAIGHAGWVVVSGRCAGMG